jgi:hypothetical protein
MRAINVDEFVQSRVLVEFCYVQAIIRELKKAY